LHLAFYRGRDHGNWLDRLIAAHDDGPHSHVELVLSDRPRIGQAVCFGSSWRDQGVRFKRIPLGGDDATQWDLVPIPSTAREVGVVRHWCIDRVGGWYDLPGVLAFKLPFVREQLGWWFCSEIAVAALQQVGRFEELVPHRVSPNALFQQLMK
jgi:hypothetical protein